MSVMREPKIIRGGLKDDLLCVSPWLVGVGEQPDVETLGMISYLRRRGSHGSHDIMTQDSSSIMAGYHYTPVLLWCCVKCCSKLTICINYLNEENRTTKAGGRAGLSSYGRFDHGQGLRKNTSCINTKGQGCIANITQPRTQAIMQHRRQQSLLLWCTLYVIYWGRTVMLNSRNKPLTFLFAEPKAPVAACGAQCPHPTGDMKSWLRFSPWAYA